MYVRPVLCRICEFPVTSSGVRVANVDLERFRRYGLKRFKTYFEDTASQIDSSWLCQFCLYEARFHCEKVGDFEFLVDWWQGNSADEKHYGKEGVIRPCKVQISSLQFSEEGGTSAQLDRAEPTPTTFATRSRTAATENKIVAADREDLASSLSCATLENSESEPIKILDVFTLCPLEKEDNLKSKPTTANLHPAGPASLAGNTCQTSLSPPSCATPGPQSSGFVSEAGPSETISLPAKSNKKWPVKSIETTCIHCCEQFNSRIDAFKHTFNFHSNKILFTCKRCFLVFKTNGERKLHSKNFHPNTGSKIAKRFQCHICNAIIFGTLSDFWKHVLNCPKTLTHEQRIQCCGAEFGTMRKLLQHMLTSKLLNCIYCQKEIHASDIKSHVLTEHRSVKISCTFSWCGKYFLNEEEKNIHVKTVHHAPDMIKCTYCSKRFKKHNMCKHVTRMHLSVQLRCYKDSCASYFLTEEERHEHFLNVHSARKHKNQKFIQHFKTEEAEAKSPTVLTGVQRMASDQSSSIRVDPDRLIGPSAPDNNRASSVKMEICPEPVENQTSVQQSVVTICKCVECNFTTTVPSVLKLHVRYIHRIGITPCEECRAKNILGDDVKKKLCEHCKTYVHDYCCHRQKFVCDTCGVTTPCRAITYIHLASCMETTSQQRNQ